jgi:hypothetical protein
MARRFEVQRVCGYKIGAKHDVQFLIKWLHYDEVTWESARTLAEDIPLMVCEYINRTMPVKGELTLQERTRILALARKFSHLDLCTIRVTVAFGQRRHAEVRNAIEKNIFKLKRGGLNGGARRHIQKVKKVKTFEPWPSLRSEKRRACVHVNDDVARFETLLLACKEE